MAVDIRCAHISEQHHLTDIAMRSKAHWGYSPRFMQDCYQELKVDSTKMSSTDYQYYVACEDDKILGFAGLQRLSESICELDGLFIDPNFIGQGVGKTLFEYVRMVLHQQHFQLMRIHSDPNAADFYQKIGANLVGYSASGSIEGRQLPVFEMAIGD